MDRKYFLDEVDRGEIRRDQTSFEFQEECRAVMEEAGLTEEEITEGRKRYNRDKGAVVFDKWLLAYRVLRGRGYNHSDLTS